MTHADYPHEPGRLFSCLECESRCHCLPDTTECVFDGDHRTPGDLQRMAALVSGIMADFRPAARFDDVMTFADETFADYDPDDITDYDVSEARASFTLAT